MSFLLLTSQINAKCLLPTFEVFLYKFMLPIIQRGVRASSGGAEGGYCPSSYRRGGGPSSRGVPKGHRHCAECI